MTLGEFRSLKASVGVQRGETLKSLGEYRRLLSQVAELGRGFGDAQGHVQAFVAERMLEALIRLTQDAVPEIQPDREGGVASLIEPGREITID